MTTPSIQKFALVTGCGEGGNGEALVKEYSTRGVIAIATVLPTESGDHLSAAGIAWFPLDVTKEESILRLKEGVCELTHGCLDVLVNNAGICYTMPAIDSDINQIQSMFDVNVFGAMRMVQHFHPMIIQARGVIVNIGSIGGISPYVYGSSYNATKAAVQHWSNTLRVEMSPFSVRVLTVIAGEIGTNILHRDRSRELPLGSYFSPLADEFKAHVTRVPETTDRFVYARAVVVESLKRTPTSWLWYGKWAGLFRFMNAFFPRTVFDWMFWRMFKLDKLRRSHELGNKDK